MASINWKGVGTLQRNTTYRKMNVKYRSSHSKSCGKHARHSLLASYTYKYNSLYRNKCIATKRSVHHELREITFSINLTKLSWRHLEIARPNGPDKTDVNYNENTHDWYSMSLKETKFSQGRPQNNMFLRLHILRVLSIIIIEWSRLAVSGFYFAKIIYLAFFNDKSWPPPI